MAKKKQDWRTKFLLVFVLFLCVLFSSTAVLLFFGMLPTIVAYFVDRSKEKLKPLTVGAMNFAGCFPFVMELWTVSDHSIEAAMELVREPKTIIIIYMAAVIGYLIDWAMSGLVAKIVQQKARIRLKEIKSLQESLIERWGEKVTGHIPIDEDGFPIDKTTAGEENADKT